MTPWTVAHHTPLSMGFPRQEYWSGVPFSIPGDLADRGFKPMSPALQVDSLLMNHWGSPIKYWVGPKVHSFFLVTSYGKPRTKLFGQPNINALTNTYGNTCLFCKILFHLMVPMVVNCDSFSFIVLAILLK